ncbi:RidA family protein [Parvularcula oceani]|uniref:RidA family protein n=1 Tax=Parvularcula oceani TaxID=1247963 RepID=UPI0004E157D1|nr:RidA family protein [Parvularcula oceani]
MNPIDQRLKSLNIALPEPAAPVASYRPARAVGGLLYVSGQLPFRDGAVVTGRLGDSLGTEEGAAAARLCGLMLLAQVRAAIGFEHLASCVKLGGFVACTPDFTDHPSVINGASDLMAEVLDEAGRHVRFAVGAPSLPLGACVEVEAIFALQ